MRDIFIFGGGAWGMALASVFRQKNNVYVLSRRPLDIMQYNSSLRAQNQISFGRVQQELSNQGGDYLDFLCYPDTSHMHTLMQLQNKDFAQCYKNAKNPLCVIAIASAFLREFMESADFLKPFYKEIKCLVASKGIERESGAFVNEILEIYLRKENLCYLAGPSFAKEVKSGLPCALVIHAATDTISKEYSRCFPNFIKIYLQDDIVGAEVAGAYKNVIAIAGGISDGLALGNNAKASLLSRGLVEMARFGMFFGAKQETFLGLSGSGDLFLTSSSTMSRNYRVGFNLAIGKKLADILEELGEVAEGVYSAKSIAQIAKKHKLYTPIASEVFAILEGGAISDGIKKLLTKHQDFQR